MIKKAAVLMMSAVLAVGTIFSTQLTVNAATKLTVSEKDYNLTIEDYPSFTSDWDSTFAKMNNTTKTDKYALSLFDDYDSTEAAIDAFKAIGQSKNMDNVIGMDVVLYQLDSDDEYYPVEGSINVNVICPVPDTFIETPEKVALYHLSEAGKLSKKSFSLVEVNGVTCMKFDVTQSSVYAFVLTDSKVESVQEKATPTPVPTKKPQATAAPTKAPVKVEPTSAPKPQSSGTQSAPQSNSKPAVNNNSSNNSASRPLDHTPQTGDTAPIGLWLGGIAVSGAAIITAIWWLKKK